MRPARQGYKEGSLLQTLLSIGLGLPTNSMHGDMSNGARWGFMKDLEVEGGKRGGGSVEGGKWKRWVQMELEIVLSF
jgi:hypothetical protein